MKKIRTVIILLLVMLIAGGMIRAFAASSGGVDFASEEYQAMIAKSLLSTGNNQRLKNAIEKAKRGEEITIAYIGGSITQGA